MSSFSSPSPPTIPSKSTRTTTPVFASVSVNNIIYDLGDLPSPSSSLPSSSPLPTPPRLMPRHGCEEGKASCCFDETDTNIYDQQDKFRDTALPWPYLAGPPPPKSQPFPSLITKFAAYTCQSKAALSCSSSSFSSAFQTTTLSTQVGSTVADDREEYDLESMNIHIRETYFATSAERGRWLSSPIAPRVRSQASPLARGHSSPIKRPADISPMRERLHKRARICSAKERFSSASSEDRYKTTRYSSPLPPSSPPMSPMSSLSFPGDYEVDSVVDPHSTSNDCRSYTGTPELSISSTACTSPIELARFPTPREACPPFCSPDPIISPHTSPRPGGSPKPTNVRAQALGTASFKADDVLSPLSQFELDLEEEPSKLPLSDTVNRPHPGQRKASPSTIVHATHTHDGLSSIQSLAMNPNYELDASLGTPSGLRPNKKVKKKREFNTGSVWARPTKKRTIMRPDSLSSETRKGGKTGNYMPDQSGLANKKFKLSRSSESHGTKSLSRRDRASEVQHNSRSIEHTGSESAHSRKSIRHARSQPPPPPPPPVRMDTAEVEFEASLTGMLVETFATSRATSMDLSALCSVLTQAHPYLVAERSKEELLAVIAAALEAGRVRSGMFDKVNSSGERSRHRVLEDRWFYVPERDNDQERAALISAIMPRQKRSETKKYKQYYYRPLDKICRWDPEDAP